MKRLFLLIPLFLLQACILDWRNGNSENGDVHRSRAIEILDVEVEDRTVHFLVKCVVPTPCYKFHSFKVEEMNTSFLISVFASAPPAPCIDVLSSIDAPVEITAPSAGEYTFSFWSDEETVDTTLVIP